MKNLKNINVYESANLIVQTTTDCTNECPDCFFSQMERVKIELDQVIYNSCLSTLRKGNLVSLRGGEITKIDNWVEKFINPAIARGLKIIVETNGYFIGGLNYTEILNKISHRNIFVRVSFDKMHIAKLDPDEKVQAEFLKMALFAKDATEKGIKFGFYSTGMNSEQVADFIKDTALESYFGSFSFLHKYSPTAKVSLKGKYLHANGIISTKYGRSVG